MTRVSHRRPLILLVLASLLPCATLLASQPNVEVPPIEARAGGLREIDELPTWSSVVDSEFAPNRLTASLFQRHEAISLEPVYYGEVFTNTRGGISTNGATQYQALLDLPLMIDFEKTDLPLPGRFFMLAQNTHGRGLTEEFVGDTQVVSNIDSFDNIMQVSEYWWEIGLLNDSVTIRLGKQDVNTEFLNMDLAQDFIQSSFGLSPSAGLPSYPDPSMAAVALADLAESVRLKLGFWDALADGGRWGFSGNEITLLFAEVEYKHALLDDRLLGTIELGVAYASGGAALGLTVPSMFGYYIQFEQLICREQGYDEGDPQGLGVFASHFPRFPSFSIPAPMILNDLVAGVMYKGLIPGRDEDVIGAGVAWTQFNPIAKNEETAFEFFYKAKVTPYMSVQPDLQYIAKPSGIHRDALVVGLRFEVAM